MFAHQGGKKVPRTQHQQAQFRANYPQENEQEMVCRTQDDWAAYPDMVYQAQPQRQQPSRPAQKKQESWPGAALPANAGIRRCGPLWRCFAWRCFA